MTPTAGEPLSSAASAPVSPRFHRGSRGGVHPTRLRDPSGILPGDCCACCVCTGFTAVSPWALVVAYIQRGSGILPGSFRVTAAPAASRWFHRGFTVNSRGGVRRSNVQRGSGIPPGSFRVTAAASNKMTVQVKNVYGNTLTGGPSLKKWEAALPHTLVKMSVVRRCVFGWCARDKGGPSLQTSGGCTTP